MYMNMNMKLLGELICEMQITYPYDTPKNVPLYSTQRYVLSR